MKKDDYIDITLIKPENWQPTMKLKWVMQKHEIEEQGCNFTNITNLISNELMQLWISNNGKTEWRKIEVENI